jgi:hypothetical protein
LHQKKKEQESDRERSNSLQVKSQRFIVRLNRQIRKFTSHRASYKKRGPSAVCTARGIEEDSSLIAPEEREEAFVLPVTLEEKGQEDYP